MSDVYMKEDCDLLVRGDRVVTTEDNNFETLKIKILQRIQAQFFDWAFTESGVANVPGINFGEFVGNIISNDLILKMKQNIFLSLIQDNLIEPENINIQEIAIDQENIVFHVSLIEENVFDETKVGLSIFYNTRQNITTSRIEEIREELWA